VFALFKSVGALLVLLYVSNSIVIFFLWTLLISIIQAFVMKFVLWYNLPKVSAKPIFDKEVLKKNWRFAAGMIGISLTAVLLTQIDKLILSNVLSLKQFGYYSISCSLGLVLYQIIGPLTQSYFPKFSALLSLNKSNELIRVYHQACQLISVLVLPAAFILVFYSKELIYIWSGSSITTENTWLVTAVYGFGTGMNAFMNIPYMLTLSYGWTRIGFVLNVCYLILMIPLTYFLSVRYGAVGGSISWAIINLLYFFITPSLIHNKILKGELFKWYWNDCIQPILAILAVIFLAKYFIPINIFGEYLQLILIFVIGILAVLTGILFSSVLRVDVYNFIKKNILHS
jgi:O-antigen/teichoic acid export membrane protein